MISGGLVVLIASQELRATLSLKKLVFTFTLFLHCFPLLSYSQASDIEFEKYTVVDGLSQSHVTCILEDRDGFMWFGTGDGLNRYDGYTFTVYRHSEVDSNSLSNNNVIALLRDNAGRIFIGTAEGLDMYNPATEHFLHIMANYYVTSIVEDDAGNKWVGTRKGLWKLSSDNQVVRRYSHEPYHAGSLSSDLIRCLAFDDNRTIWVGTDGGGLNSFDTELEVFSHFVYDPAAPNSISSNIINALTQDHAGTIWAGTSTGLNRYDRHLKTWKRFTNKDTPEANYYQNYILSLAEDPLRRLWVGTDEGLSLYDTTGRMISHAHLDPSTSGGGSNEILAIQFGSDGTLWCGTKNGIRKHSPYAKKFVSYHHIPLQNNSLISSKVWSVYVDNGNMLWVGTDNGLTRIDRTTNQYKHFKHDPADPASLGDDVVLSLLEDRDGRLWVGTWRSLDRFDKATEHFEHYMVHPGDRLSLSNSVMMMQAGKNGSLWIGGWNSIHHFDPRSGKFVDEATLTTMFHDITFGTLLEDRAGTLWIGTVGRGLLRYDQEKKTITEFVRHANQSTSVSNNFVNALHESRDGKIWIGTSEGLDVLDTRSMTFAHYSTEHGLSNSFIGGILEGHGGDLWLSTNGGLSRFDPATLTFRNYDASDGLQSNEFNNWSAHFNRSGELFFGGVNGLTSFFPESLKDNPHVPPIRVTSFKAYSQGQLPSRVVGDYAVINLGYPENTFSFEFTALDFTIPKKNQYAYMLEGFDRDWLYCAHRRFATYTNLDPGKYVLRVKGSNNDGLWNEAGVSIPLNILPPFWRTWWFRGSMVTAFALLLTTLFYVRLRSVKMRNIVLETKVSERTRELYDTNEILKSQIETRKRVEAELKLYESQLESKVRDKTFELSRIVDSLESEVTERKRVEQKLLEYQEHLRSLASELSITEDRERQRMATYLHDYVGQALSMCKLKLDILKEGRRPVPIDEISALLLQAIDHTRSLTIDLSPPILRELNFADAIEWLTQQFQHQHHIPISFDDDKHPRQVSDDMKTFLYHTVRELLTNIIKHAHAKSAGVVLQNVSRDLVIHVRDDGAGFNPGGAHIEHNKKSFGLFNIRERLLHFSGTLELISQPHSGTCVVLTIPLAALGGGK